MIQKLVDGAVLLAELKAKTKEAALKELLQRAQEAGAFPKKNLAALQKRLAEREAIGSTGLGNGVAVPHVKSDEIKEPTLVLARVKAGIEWQAIDGRPAQILFLLATPGTQPEEHLQCLRWIATLARSGDFRRFLLDAGTPEAMRDLLRELRPKT
jgi:PTS system fructose-specific IIC component